MIFDDARAVPDAVLFEDDALDPCRASAPKNQARSQPGVLAPRSWSEARDGEAGAHEAWWQETEVLLEPEPGAAALTDAATAGQARVLRIQGQLRFLHIQRLGDGGAPSVDRAGEDSVREIDFAFDVARALATRGEEVVPFLASGGHDTDAPTEPRRWPISGVVRLRADRAPADRPLVALRVRVENVTAWALPRAPRDQARRASLVASHVLLAATGGAFVSLMDPPPWAVAAASSCENVRTYPVLAGRADRRDLVLSAPIILYDHPAIAFESPPALFDAAAIDDILARRLLTLTDDERREARATDPRLKRPLDNVERLDGEPVAGPRGATCPHHPVAPSAAGAAPGETQDERPPRPGARRG